MNVTFSLTEETLRKLREAARDFGGSRRGAISNLVEVAIKEHLQEVQSRRKQEEFRAMRGSRVVARAGSLRELASALEKNKVDPRDVLIVSSSSLRGVIRTGLRRQLG